MLQLAEDQRLKRRASAQKAHVTRLRNNILRRSSLGKLLLVLERCELFSDNLNQRAMARLQDELRYACTLADTSGIRYGWIMDGVQRWALAFELSSGDAVFATGEVWLTDLEFPRLPRHGQNERVLADAIEQVATLRHSEPKIPILPRSRIGLPL